MPRHYRHSFLTMFNRVMAIRRSDRWRRITGEVFARSVPRPVRDVAVHSAHFVPMSIWLARPQTDVGLFVHYFLLVAPPGGTSHEE